MYPEAVIDETKAPQYITIMLSEYTSQLLIPEDPPARAYADFFRGPAKVQYFRKALLQQALSLAAAHTASKQASKQQATPLLPFPSPPAPAPCPPPSTAPTPQMLALAPKKAL
ncbi:hypothetical protein PG994_008760 [Apiospora phragmitis]|uniref:Uncharacterized protein n=1 Tax=Apiospora phragmitis TaxID=2905665 RepID=A0ABR1UHX7_9PEZI